MNHATSGVLGGVLPITASKIRYHGSNEANTWILRKIETPVSRVRFESSWVPCGRIKLTGDCDRWKETVWFVGELLLFVELPSNSSCRFFKAFGFVKAPVEFLNLVAGVVCVFSLLWVISVCFHFFDA